MVTGTGGADSGGSNAGVTLSSATVMAAGSGTVTVHGNGGTNAGSSNDGIDEYSGSTITSGGGNVSVTGQGGGSSASGSPGSDQGVYIGGTVSSTGSGGVTVTGTGGPGNGGSDFGVWVGGDGTVTSGSTGTVTIQGTGGNGARGLHRRCLGGCRFRNIRRHRPGYRPGQRRRIRLGPSARASGCTTGPSPRAAVPFPWSDMAAGLAPGYRITVFISIQAAQSRREAAAPSPCRAMAALLPALPTPVSI